jgi:RNA polymerase sigma factor (sigma-70 family)
MYMMAFFSKTYTDPDLIEGIREDSSKRRTFENKLYERYAYLIREGVWRHKLSEDECSMAYSDTILTVIEHIQSGRFENRSSLKTYLNQIFTNKCVDLIRKNTTNKQQVNRGETIDDYLYLLPDDSRSIVEKLIDQYDMDLLRDRLRELGDKCRQMIEAWGDGFMDQEIAVEMGYQSAAVVKTSRLRCLEKLRALYRG